jgi:hypothetical protein
MATFQDHLQAMKRQGFGIPADIRGQFPGSASFTDDEGMMFMARELEQMEARTFDVLYQDLMYKQLFPVDSSINPGAKSITYKVYDKRGKPRWINSKAKDLPRADVDGRDVTTYQHMSGLSYGYSLQEIMAARFAGVPLEQAKANAVRRGFEDEMNLTAFAGNADLGFVGFFTVGNGIPRTTAPNGAGGDSEWDTKTPDEIIADIALLFTKPIVDSKQKERPTELWLPTAQYLDLKSRRLTDTGETLFSYIARKSGWLTGEDKIVSVPDLTGAGTAGVDVAVAATRNPDKLEQKISQDVTFYPVQQQGLEWVVPAAIVYGGLVIRYPAAFHILEAI